MATMKIYFDSHKEYGTSYEDIILGRFSYTSPGSAITLLMEYINMYNNEIIKKEKKPDKFIIKCKSTNIDTYKATIYLCGKKTILQAFINTFITKTDVLKYFDVTIK